MHGLRALVWLPVAVALAACWRAAPAPSPAFAVDRVSPDLAPNSPAMLLNDSVTVYFSAAIHPLSVTADSVTVFDGRGHPVPGSLKTGANWVTFAPEPPLTPDLSDGSFRAGERYRLVVAGYPRPDAVQAADGRRLDAVETFELRMAEAGAHGKLPAPLRPPATDLPFLLRTYDAPQPVPADAPRLRLHFTSPVLPQSARPEAFVVKLHRGAQEISPRHVRLVSSRLDQFPGSTVEIDLGVEPRTREGSIPVRLRNDDLLFVALANGADCLRDLAGNPVLPGFTQCWSVVPGAAIALVAWPEEEGGVVGDDALWPGFESLAGVVRPRVRVEAGDGSLGVFRPTQDTVLQPGVSFDRGDGVAVRSRGTAFPFLAIDVPKGIRVRVDGRGGAVQLLACGSIRIEGELELAGATAALPTTQHGEAVAELIDQAPVALLAAGDVHVSGSIVMATPPSTQRTALTIASAGRIHLWGELPVNTVLVVESQTSRSLRAIPGARGQTIATSATFTYGVPEGASIVARGCSPWRQMALDRDGGVLRLVDVDPGMRVAWQTVPADLVDATVPDLRADRLPRPRAALDQEWIAVEPGSFMRFQIETEVVAGRAAAKLRELRLVDR